MTPLTAYFIGYFLGAGCMALAAWACWPVEIEDYLPKTGDDIWQRSQAGYHLKTRRKWRGHDEHEDAGV